MGRDTQPNALVMASILLFLIPNKKMSPTIIILIVLALLSFPLAAFSTLPTFTTIKNVVNYISVPIVAFAAYTIYKREGNILSERSFLIFILIYAFIGLVQYFINPNFMLSLVNLDYRGVLIAGRGVNALTSEPAYYGSMCLFFIIFAIVNYRPKFVLMVSPIILLQLVLLARTATAVGILLLSCAVFTAYLLFRFRIKVVLTVALLALTSIVAFNRYKTVMQDSRLVGIIETVAENPLLITELDQSASIRITNTLSPYISIWHNKFMPQGFGNYIPFVKHLYYEHNFRRLINARLFMRYDRITGSLSLVLFHMGFIGLLFLYAIYLGFKPLLDNSAVIFAFILFLLIISTQIPLMNAMIAFIIGSTAGISKRKQILNT